MFGDIGEGITDENGECIVEIGDIFTETVTTRIESTRYSCRKKERRFCGLKRRKRITSLCTELQSEICMGTEKQKQKRLVEYVNLEEDVDREEKIT